MGKIPCCDKNGLKKGPWTPEEDQKLIDYIQKHGQGRWRTLPKNAGLKRCGKSCRLRWANYLRPDIKRGRFSFEEEETIIQLHRVLGNKWSIIASRLPGRTDNEIKNYWNTHIRKRLLKMGIDPVTHTPRLDLLELSSFLCSTLYNNASSNALLNIPNLLGIGPIMDPGLLNLATTLFSCQRRPSSSSPEFPSQNHVQQSRHGLFQNNENQFQSQLIQPHQLQNPVQEIQHCTTSNTLNIAPFPNQTLPINFSYPDSSNVAGSYDSTYESIINNDNNPSQNYQQACFSNIVNDQNFQNMSSLGSLLSATPSSSPETTLNSSPVITYVYSSTEDERDSFCSNILMYDHIPDGLNVSELPVPKIIY